MLDDLGTAVLAYPDENGKTSVAFATEVDAKKRETHI
jgi:hypothetical protein